MKVSIITPIYNAAAHLPRCKNVVMGQTLQDLEWIVVDDGSTDGGAELVRDIAKVITLQQNGGVAAARNAGLGAATGDYICWLDADDALLPAAIAEMVDAIGDADILGCDWYLGFDSNARYMRQADYTYPETALKAMMGGLMRWNLWAFMARRELYDGVSFLPGKNMGEDMLVTCSLFAKAAKVKQLHKAFYRYNAVSESSLSRQFSEVRRAEVSTNIEALLDTIAKSAYSSLLNPYANYLKMFIKQPLLMSSSRSDWKIWQEWMPEANGAVNPDLPARTRLVQKMASNNLWPGVWLYHFLVYKLVYGLIYR